MSEEPSWLAIARKELGQAEIPGTQDNPRIIEYLKTVELPTGTQVHDEVSWCSAFVNWTLKQSGNPGTNSPAARSWEKWGMYLKVPQVGCVVVIKRGSIAWQGHVGFYVGAPSPAYVTLLGGNQSDKVCIENFPAWRVTAYRWPGTQGGANEESHS